MIRKLCLFAGIATLLGPSLVWGQTTNHSKDMTNLSEEELKRQLTPEQYYVTRQAGTEPAFNNAYWDNHGEVLYVDGISGQPLFTSKNKFDSGTSWTIFTKPADAIAA